MYIVITKQEVWASSKADVVAHVATILMAGDVARGRLSREAVERRDPRVADEYIELAERVLELIGSEVKVGS